MSKKVKNYVMEPLGSHRFKNVTLDESETVNGIALDRKLTKSMHKLDKNQA